MRLLLFFILLPALSVAQLYGPPTIPAIRTQDYYIEYYPNWQNLEPNTGDTLFVTLSPYGTAHDPFRENVTLTYRTIDQNQPLILGEYVDYLREELLRSDPSAVFVEGKRMKDRNGTPYEYLKYEALYKQLPLIVEYRCYVKKHTVYLLALCCQKKGDSYNTWLCRQLVKSFYVM